MTSLAPVLAAYAERHAQQLDHLMELVRTPSVSSERARAHEVARSAAQVAASFLAHGFQRAEVLALPDVHPYVVAEHHVSDHLPTVLLYAHHDVQPAGDLGLWETPPFTPTVRDGRLYGRGAADDKAGIAVHLAACQAHFASGTPLPVNVKVVIEGEEEVGSANLEAFMRVHAERLSAQAMVLTDTSNIDTGVPSITISLRGLVVVDVEVRALAQAVHSGMWGGPLPDAAMVLAKMLAGLTDARGRVAVPGIEWVAPTAAEAQADAALPVTPAAFAAQAGLLSGTLTEQDFFHSLWRAPSLAINALQASSEAEARNVLMDRAWARVGLRLAPDADPIDSALKLEHWLMALAPAGVTVHLRRDTANGGWRTDTAHPAFRACEAALEAGYGRAPVYTGCGGSIPFVKPMARALGAIPALLLGVEDPHTRAHAENESLHLGDFRAATRSAIHLLHGLRDVL